MIMEYVYIQKDIKMNKMIEKVAKSLYEHWRNDITYVDYTSWEKLTKNDYTRNFMLKVACAAIEALKQDVNNYDEKLMNCFRSASVQEWNKAIDYCNKGKLNE